MIQKLLLYIFFISNSFLMLCQGVEEIPAPEYIKTIQFIQNGQNKNGIPLIKLGTRFEISFDDIIGDEAFYYYKINYFNFDWTPTIISKNEYLEGIDNVLVNDTENSFNSLQIYTHYKINLPNRSTRALKRSGNYIFELYNNEQELVFSKKFIIYENIATIQASVERSRDLKFLNKKQIIQFKINSNQLLINPDKNLKVLVLQNNNLKTAITNLKPQYTIGNSYTYRYNKEASFWGGNEYLNFDNKDVRNATANISYIELNEIYHNFLFAGTYRALFPYTFYPDVNGNFVIRNIDADNNDIEAEYVWIHFKLNVQNISDKEVHIYGGFNNYTTDKSTLLTFDDKIRAYTGKRLFKQGFYNFKYVTKNKDDTINEGDISGNFDETENEYIIVAYYKAPGERSERIIGTQSVNSVSITN